LWPEGESVVGPRVSGESLSLSSAPGAASDAWFPAAATLGAANPEIGPDADVWTSCSQVRPWAPEVAATPLAVLSLDVSAQPTIILANTTDAALDLTPFTLVLVDVFDNAGVAASELTLALSGTLEAGAHASVGLCSGAGCDCGDTDLCWTDARLSGAGELAVFELVDFAAVMRQYVAWGTLSDVNGTAGDAPRLRSDEAVAASLWPLSDCSAHGLAATTPVVLDDGASGRSPPDYE
jgi:hypothetical protein